MKPTLLLADDAGARDGGAAVPVDETRSGGFRRISVLFLGMPSGPRAPDCPGDHFDA